MAVEEPPFKVALQEGSIELRAYPSLVAAEVTLETDRDKAGNAGFRLLAGYIFGGNEGSRSIAMTAPVVMAPAKGQSIAMTAPVTQTGTGNTWTVRFFMPAGYTLDSLPRPKDSRVHLTQLPAAEFAVIRFAGLALESDVAQRTLELQAFIRARHWRETGVPSLARYNPPWTLWFLRRNEVWIPVGTGAPG